MSVKRGFGAPKPRRAEGVPVMLADIPNVTAGHLTKLIGAFRTAGGQAIETSWRTTRSIQSYLVE
jgi:CTP:molybdopterin cytidylyltransferase MocA